MDKSCYINKGLYCFIFNLMEIKILKIDYPDYFQLVFILQNSFFFKEKFIFKF